MLGWRLVRVTGDSMAPLLPAGSFCIFRRQTTYTVGDILLVHHDDYGRIIKKYWRSDPAGIWLSGLSPQSISSEKMGCLPVDRIMGRLIWCSKPA